MDFFKGKYEKELPVKENVIIANFPILAWIAFIRLGWRYGSIAFLTHFGIIAGLATIVMVLFVEKEEYTIDTLPLAGYVVIGGTVALYFFSYSLAVWYLIKKHNAR